MDAERTKERAEQGASPVARIGDAFAGWARRHMPDPYVLALLLTLTAFAAALALTDATPGALVAAWADGIWGFLGFAMQMALILVTGHAIASAPPVRRAIHRLAGMPRTGAGAAALTALIAGLAGLVNWGLALVVGAYLAREMGRQAEARGLAVHYPLLGAAGYLGMLVWHGGLSGSAPLVMATAKRDLLPALGVVPISRTIFAPSNLVTTLAVVLVSAGLVWLMAPREGALPFSAIVPDAGAPEAPPPAPAGRASTAAWILGGLAAAALTFALVRAGLAAGRAVDVSSVVMASVNALAVLFVVRQVVLGLLDGDRRPRLSRATATVAGLLSAGGVGLLVRGAVGGGGALAAAAGTALVLPPLLLAGGRVLGLRPGDAPLPAAELDSGRVFGLLFGLAALGYIEWRFASGGFSLDLNTMILAFLAVGLLLRETPASYVEAVGEAAPGTAGILLQFPFYAGILAVMKVSGLLAVVAGGMVAVANATFFPVLAFLSAGLVNVFVPSGGGQWAVQGPVVVEAARTLGVPIHKAILAVAYGDEWTNMLQPFWALPLLGITGLKAKDIVGYTLVVMLAAGVLFAGGLLLP